MKQNNHKIADLNSKVNELKDILMKEYQIYSARTGIGYEWSGQDFANLYNVNLELLNIIKQQSEMIKNIYDILDRQEVNNGCNIK